MSVASCQHPNASVSMMPARRILRRVPSSPQRRCCGGSAPPRSAGRRGCGCSGWRGHGGFRARSTKVDYVGAAALWREAAERGDAISQLELGKILMFGHGLQPNSGEAIRMFRLAADRLPVAAVGPATALISNSIAGDAASAREAIELLEAGLGKNKKTGEVGGPGQT